jgi:oxalate---CoA ligase
LLGLSRAPLSYRELTQLVGAAAARLSERDIRPADRVALLVENGPEAAAAFLAIACAATCAPLNPSYRREELDFYLDDLRARAVVVSHRLDSPVRGSAKTRGIPVLELEPRPDLPAGGFDLDGPLTGGIPLPVRSPDEHALVLHTSGTTSRPKLVPLTHQNLVASAGNVARSLALEPEDRCLNVMPLFHIHGLVAALLAPLRAGGSVACTPGFHPIRIFDWLRDFEPTWFTAVPTMHQALLARTGDHPDAVRQHKLRFIRSSSASLPASVLEQLEQVFGVPVIEAYGMTEAAHQMSSNPLPPGRRRPGQVGLPAGPEIAILSPDGTALPAGSVGEVAVRGENVFSGYERNPEANAASFSGNWFRTGDEGSLDPDGFLTLHGRIKELINRGGEKVAPLEVDERLLEHPAVAEAVTFAVPDPRLGEEVAAAVVLAPGQQVDEPSLQEHVAQTLAPFKVPRKVVFMDEIRKGPTGKPQRVGLAEQLGISGLGNAPAEHEEVLTDFERWIAKIWENVLDVPSVGRHDDFFSLGGDSILGAEAVARLREVTGQAGLPLVSIVRSPTVATMARELDAGVSALAHSGPIALNSPDPGSRPFFFVHGGDGEVLSFRSLAQAIGPSISFFGIRARGIDDGAEPDGSIEEMAAAYVDGIREVQPHGPYAIGGFCLGALVAIEMACRLDAAGEAVSLVLVDPRLPRPKDLRYRLWLVVRRSRQRRLVGSIVGFVARRITIKSREGPPAATGIEASIARLRDAHRPKRCGAPAVTIIGNDHLRYEIPLWVLRRHVPGFRTIRVPVGHTPMLQLEGAGILAREIRAVLDARASPR